MSPITLTGTYVRLEPSSLDHAPALARIATPETFRYFVTGAPKSCDEVGMADYVQKRIENPTVLPFTVFDLASGNVVGMTTYMDIRPEHRGLEIGMTWYAESARGTKVNPECKLLLISHAIEVLGYVRVQLKTDGRNLQSQRAIAKLGAKYEGTLRNHMIFESDGYIRDTVMYSIVPEDWPEVKVRLLMRI